ncbi:MAG: ferrous iron transport protein B [Lachnospiraceae bacterium]|nr:ferrous iron transport protein B [Lachnospiraceae bacterium]
MAIKIALTGNPNCGKTTLFNILTGSNQFVGNWPGVTVEKKEGRFKEDKEVTVIDLPGIYSLSPYSPEEVVSRNYLLDEHPDVILNIVDGTSLERSLFLTTQLTELGIPVVVAINMMDVVNKRGDEIDTERLGKTIGCRVTTLSALKGDGVNEAVQIAILMARNGKTVPQHSFSGSVEHTLAHIEEAVLHDFPEEQQRWFAIKLFERDEKIVERLNLHESILTHIDIDIKNCEKELDDDSESIITTERYTYIDAVMKKCYQNKSSGKLTVSDKIDRIVTNRILALPIFVLVMVIVYAVSVTTVGAWATNWANNGVFGEGWKLLGHWIPGVPVLVDNALTAIGCAGWLRSLVVDGMIAGVGAVLGFVPQLLILFAFLAFLEGCGYMARIAFILDRIFRKFGLSGRSFIPILIGTGCGVPGIMASRTIESERDRRLTVMTTTFIPCSAKLPIIALFAGTLFNGAWWVAPSAYFIGITAIICSGTILKKTKRFSGEEIPFVMELPSYHMPTVSSIIHNMWERGWSFIKKAGTIILLASAALWFMSGFGWEGGHFGMVSMDHSILAHIGNAVAWIFAPLGWGNWKATVATFTGLIAKESIVGTFGILYNLGEVAVDNVEMKRQLAGDFTALSAYSFLIFNLLCAPCVAAMGAIRREMNSHWWFWYAIGYQCGLAYAAAFCFYQLGLLFTKGYFGIDTIMAFLAVGLFFWLLVKNNRRREG